MKLWILATWMVAAGLGSADELAAAKTEFGKQDKALNATYAALKKELPEHLFSVLQEDQREWVEYRDYIADWQAGGEDPATSPVKWETAAGITESRIGWLKAWSRIGKVEGWGGRYSDSRGGELEIVEQNGKFHFRLSVVRGPTHHLGDIGGEFRVNGGMAWFEVKVDGEEKPTWLTFLREQDGTERIRVFGENTGYFHGARAYFDGSYLRTGDLSEAERKKVIEGEVE